MYSAFFWSGTRFRPELALRAQDVMNIFSGDDGGG